MVKKRIIIAVVILVLLAVAVGCGGGATQTAATTPASPTTKTTTPAQTTAAPTTTAATGTPTPTKTVPPTTTTVVAEPTETQEPEPTPTPTPEPTETPEPTPLVFTLTSTAFVDGGEIPAVHCYLTGNKSPELDWTGAPEGTVSFALIMEDPDGGNWTHWVIFNIGADITGLGEQQPMLPVIGDNIKQGANSWGEIGYGGPSPPAGTGVHHYYFRLYALDTMLDLAAGATRSTVISAMTGHILGQVELMGTRTG